MPFNSGWRVAVPQGVCLSCGRARSPLRTSALFPGDLIIGLQPVSLVRQVEKWLTPDATRSRSFLEASPGLWEPVSRANQFRDGEFGRGCFTTDLSTYFVTPLRCSGWAFPNRRLALQAYRQTPPRCYEAARLAQELRRDRISHYIPGLKWRRAFRLPRKRLGTRFPT